MNTRNKLYLAIALGTLLVLGCCCITVTTLWVYRLNTPVRTLYAVGPVSPGSIAIQGKTYFQTVDDFGKAFCDSRANPIEGRVLKCKIEQVDNISAYLIYEYSSGDDSVAARRMIYRLDNKEIGWTVVGIKNELRCWEDRGNSNWHEGRCN